MRILCFSLNDSSKLNIEKLDSLRVTLSMPSSPRSLPRSPPVFCPVTPPEEELLPEEPLPEDPLEDVPCVPLPEEPSVDDPLCEELPLAPRTFCTATFSCCQPQFVRLV